MKTAVSPCSSPTETLADLATKQERLLTTARAFQTTGLTNGRVANWVPEVEFSPFRALTHRQMTSLFCCLRGSLPKSGPLDFATKNTFALFFVSEEALVGVY